MYGPAGSRDHYPRGTRAEVDDPITPNARTPERAQEYRALFLTDDLHGWRFVTNLEASLILRASIGTTLQFAR
jgi:hypothetical protein